MRKRLLSLLLLTALLLTLFSSCKGDANDASTPNGPTLNGIPLTEYVIVCDGLAKRSGDKLAEQLNQTLGVQLPVVLENAHTGAGNAIYIGKFGYHSYGERRYAITAKETEAGQQIYLYADGSSLAAAAVDCFMKEYVKETMTVTGTDQRYAFRESDHASGLRFNNEETKQPMNGVTYIRRSYTRADNKNVFAYITIISPELVPYIKSAAPAPGEVETVPKQAEAANAFFGVNAGFFYIHESNLPVGVCIVNGEVQKAPSSESSQTNLWFGITNDGKAVISDASGYLNSYVGKLPSAVGGSAMIIKNGKLSSTPDSLNPLTTVGICEDGSVVFVCVDGRSAVSAGATHADMAQIYMELDMGVQSVLNLDGGGSTTVVFREGDAYKVKNSPSDGKLRPVQSVLLLCPPN